MMTVMGAAAARVVRNDEGARALVDPARRQLLRLLVEPDSAAGVARKTGLPRQRVNYHLREMEKAGLLKLVEERKKGNCTERLVQATAAMYVISPEALGELGADPSRVGDRMSSAYLVALAARAIRELAVLRERADAVGKPLQTMSLSADVRFASQEKLNAFSEELANAMARLIAKYGDEQAEGGRVFRVLLGGWPAVTKTDEEARAEAQSEREEESTGGSGAA